MHILELLSSRQCFHKNGRVISALTHLGKWPLLLMTWLGHRFLPEGRAGWLVPSFFLVVQQTLLFVMYFHNQNAFSQPREASKKVVRTSQVQF